MAWPSPQGCHLPWRLPSAVLRNRSPLHPFWFVSFHRVTYHIPFIWSLKSHSYILAFMHPHIDTFVNSHSCVHNAHAYTTSSHTWLHQSLIVCFGSIPSVWSSIISSGKFQQTNSLNPFKSVIPSDFGQEVSLIMCQVASSNKRTTWTLSKVSSPVCLV